MKKLSGLFWKNPLTKIFIIFWSEILGSRFIIIKFYKPYFLLIIGFFLKITVIFFFSSNLFFLNALEITEIMANPKGKDEKNEWIELYNFSNEELDLENYQLKIGDKFYKFEKSQKIKGDSFLLIDNKNGGFTLKNSDNQLQLLKISSSGENFSDYVDSKIIEKIEYSKTKEGESLSKIKIVDSNGKILKTNWINSDPSPKSKNPQIYFLKGKVKNELEKINEEKYFFEVEFLAKNSHQDKIEFLNNKSTKKVIFNSQNINPLLAELLLKVNQEFYLTAKKNSQGVFELKEIKILNPD